MKPYVPTRKDNYLLHLGVQDQLPSKQDEPARETTIGKKVKNLDGHASDAGTK